jgi:Subtilisin-like serine proteases
MKALYIATGFLIACALSLFTASCSGVTSSSTSTTTTTTTSSASSSSGSSQASYQRLDVTDSSAWKSAVASGYVREGSVLVKTSASFDSSKLASLGATETGSITTSGGTWRRLSVTSGEEASVIESLRAMTGVMIAEPENRLHIPSGESGTSASKAVASSRAAKSLGDSSVLDDPYTLSAQYNLTIADAISAYKSYPPSATVYAAVLDTGLNIPHQEFKDSSGSSIVALAKSAFTRNSASSYTYVGDNKSFVTISSSTSASTSITANWDDDGHGTHVSGIIAAVGNNDLGTAGVAWKGLKLISYKVITDNESGSSSGSGSDWAVYGALEDLADWWATASNHSDSSQITLPVNISLGSYYASSFEIEMLAYALKKNVLVIAAMGNDGKKLTEYPAAYTGVVAVGATDGSDEKAEFSTTGDWMSVCAPGYDIISTYSDGTDGDTADYAWESGTSMAAPFVTGTAAYVLGFAPSLAPDQIKTILEESADLVGGESAYSSGYGYGRVNVASARTLATGSSVPVSGSVYSTYTLTVTVTYNSGTALTSQPVYLYDSDGNYIELGLTSSDGTVSFTLLKPSLSYVAKTTYGGATKTATGLSVASSDSSATLAF